MKKNKKITEEDKKKEKEKKKNEIYEIEHTRKIGKIPKIQPYLLPSISNVSLEIIPSVERENSEKRLGNLRTINYTNGAQYSIREKKLTGLPKNEIFEGKMTSDYKSLLKGVYYWPNGQKYTGDFNTNNNFETAPNSKSNLKMENINIEAVFSDGKIIGDTIYTLNDGQIIVQGDFKDGKIEGPVFIKDKKEGYSFDGNIKNMKKEGETEIIKTIEGKTYKIKGNFSNNKKEGEFEIVKEESKDDEKIFSLAGTYKNDLRDGYFDLNNDEDKVYFRHLKFPRRNILCYAEINKYNSGLKETDIQPLFKCNLENLRILNLGRNKISSIDFLDTDPFTMSNLEKLILSDNNISSIDAFSEITFPALKELLLGNNKIVSIQVFTECEFNELEVLNLSNNKIDSLEGFENVNWPKLKTLLLNRNCITDVTSLTKAKLPSLSDLDIHNNKITKPAKLGPLNFEECPMLVTLKK